MRRLLGWYLAYMVTVVGLFIFFATIFFYLVLIPNSLSPCWYLTIPVAIPFLFVVTYGGDWLANLIDRKWIES